ncbi:MAG: succinate dehydrogenase assembly factor 2 [Pseudomonadota bacterium]
MSVKGQKQKGVFAADTPDDIDAFRRQLTFRSWHRGTREADLLLGGFADRHLASFGWDELHSYRRLIEESDPDLYNWITGREPVPDRLKSPVADLLVAHKREPNKR